MFTGNLSVSEMNRLYSMMGTEVPDEKKCFIGISDVDHIDMSFFQLLYSYLKKLKMNGKEIVMDIQLDEEQERLLERAGLKRAFDQILKN
ncbi:MAG: hypothetical protein JXR65_11930 [Bacteroidales bacterium]|nr:hypothetical protein [Bacteroidales bacterium]